MLSELKNGPKVAGVKQTKRAIGDGRAVRVFLAEDADPRLTDPVRTDCAALGVALVSVPTMAELGKACGISVGAAAAGLLA